VKLLSIRVKHIKTVCPTCGKVKVVTIEEKNGKPVESVSIDCKNCGTNLKIGH